MNRNILQTSKTWVLVGTILVLTGASLVGCQGGDAAPTNTASSKYIDNGQTAADKIGADRERAHRRLPGAAPTNPPAASTTGQ